MTEEHFYTGLIALSAIAVLVALAALWLHWAVQRKLVMPLRLWFSHPLNTERTLWIAAHNHSTYVREAWRLRHEAEQVARHRAYTEQMATYWQGVVKELKEGKHAQSGSESA